jgi:hypothetical protein
LVCDKRSANGLILYQTGDNRTRIEVRLENETVWFTQKLLAELFQKDVRTVNEHIQNIFELVELSPDSVIRNFRITAADGKTYDTQHCNLDVIMPVIASCDFGHTTPILTLPIGGRCRIKVSGGETQITMITH